LKKGSKVVSPKKPTNNKKAQELKAQADQEQLQHLLASYQQIGQQLDVAEKTARVEEALSDIFSQSVPTQLAFFKELGKREDVVAANILNAAYHLAPEKEARKEARRSLIQLEGAKIIPEWVPPTPPSFVTLNIASGEKKPRFWQAIYTDSRDIGEVELLVCWYEGEEYEGIRVMGFLLDFWDVGIKEFFTDVMSKRQLEQQIEYTRANFEGVKLIKSPLARARLLLEEALEVHRAQGSKLPPEYTHHSHLVRKLILEAPEAHAGNEDEEEVYAEGATPSSKTEVEELFQEFFGISQAEDVVRNFLEFWTNGEFIRAYDLLSRESPLKQGLPREEWVKLHKRWFDTAHPTRFNPHVIHAREVDDLFESDEDRYTAPVEDEEDVEVVDALWSMEMIETPIARELPALPQATAHYARTGRYWFWTAFKLVEENEQTRIHSLTDEGGRLLGLPDAELQRGAAALERLYKEELGTLGLSNEQEIRNQGFKSLFDQDDENIDIPPSQRWGELAELLTLLTQMLHYQDALIARAPQKAPVLYQTAGARALLSLDAERAAYYYQLLAERFPEQQAFALRKMAEALQLLSQELQEERADIARVRTIESDAEQALQEALTKERTPEALILLARQLIQQDNRRDEAEELLLEAATLSPSTPEATQIEGNLGLLYEQKGNLEQALMHYQRAAEITPHYPGVWTDIGDLQMRMRLYDSAELSFLRSIDIEPDNVEAYIQLGLLYRSVKHDPVGAEDVLLQGLETHGSDANLLASLALTYVEQGKFRDAENYLEKAEELAPDFPLVQEAREAYEVAMSYREHLQRKKRKRPDTK
jgi:tetratricopeptide (TPR) repeat protein